MNITSIDIQKQDSQSINFTHEKTNIMRNTRVPDSCTQDDFGNATNDAV